MKRKILYVFVLLAGIIFMYACEKEDQIAVPDACISINSSQINIFENLEVTNCSGPADFYVLYNGTEGSEYDHIGDTTLVDRKGNYIYQTTSLSMKEGGSIEFYYTKPGVYKLVMVATNVSRWGGDVKRDTTSVMVTVN